MNLLVTGANGFVGRALSIEAVTHGEKVRGATRLPCELNANVETVAVGDIDEHTDWRQALMGCDVVIHLAARVHVMHELASNPLNKFCRVNAAGTERLARCAAANGVRRLVYVSSIKVNGEETMGDQRYSELGVPDPQDPYGASKWEAEQTLHRVASETGLEVVIVRSPLVYGAGVKGNFAQMLRFVSMGIPLPLASVNNQRDLIYVGNLVDALLLCAKHPAAAANTYLVSDGEAVSTPDLLNRLASALGVSSRLFPVPAWLLKVSAKLVGKSAQVERLLGSLQVDSTKIRHELGWHPPYTLQQGLHETVSAIKGNF